MKKSNDISYSKSKEKENKSWSRSKSTDRWEETIKVEKLDGPGFLVVINVCGENAKGEYKDITKKYYSDDNPLDEKETSPVDDIFDILVGNNRKT